MFARVELPKDVILWSKDYKRHFTFTHMTLEGNLVDENGVVHLIERLEEPKPDVR